MNNKLKFKKYLKHTVLQWFTQSLFFVFGALLIYVKTNSILLVLLFMLIGKIISILWKSLGINYISSALNYLGLVKFMGLSLTLTATSFFGIYLIDSANQYFLISLIFLSMLHSTGESSYWIVSNTIRLDTTGALDNPGKATSLVSIAHIISGIFAAILGIVLSINKNFLALLPFGGIVLLTSILPLRKIKMPKEKKVKFSDCLKKISPKAFFANISFMGQYRRTALPLIIFIAFESLSISIWVSGLTAIGAAFVSYGAGYLKDKGNSCLSIIALPLLILTWIFYGFASTPILFIILGISDKLLLTIVEIGKESKLSREVNNSKKPYEATVAIEFARSLGQIIVLILMIFIFIYTNTLPQKILILGALFILPSALYAIGKIDKKIC